LACERLDYSQDELLQISFADIVVPEHASLAHEGIEELRRRGHTFFETAYIKRDGTQVPVEISSRLINYEGSTFCFTLPIWRKGEEFSGG
jgi:PAS domain S-box-containing protein